MTASLSEKHSERYSRQLMIEGFDEEAQQSLLDGRVLVVGAGGLGSAAIQYLAAAGVGTIGIADGGQVKLSNLQRQVIHQTGTLGEAKVDSARRYVNALNPDIEVTIHDQTIIADVAPSIIESYDVVIDGLDNFRGRFLLNDVARLADIPFVHGAIFGFEGQATVFVPDGPCYRCLLPGIPDDDQFPSDEPIGIFPTLPGIIGCIEATEAIKYLIDVGELLDGRLLRFDGLDGTFVTSPIEPRAACPVCGDDPIETIDAVDYDGDCRVRR